MNFLTNLGIAPDNAGTYFGRGEWSSLSGDAWIESRSPTSGELLARVRPSTEADYSRLMERAQAYAREWAMIPAPRRGEAVRLVGEALRAHKADLGRLVSLEMGKIKAEGEGEVQEMIDIADFAGAINRPATAP